MYKEVDSVGEFYAAIIPRLTCNNAVLLENKYSSNNKIFFEDTTSSCSYRL